MARHVFLIGEEFAGKYLGYLCYMLNPERYYVTVRHYAQNTICNVNWILTDLEEFCAMVPLPAVRELFCLLLEKCNDEDGKIGRPLHDGLREQIGKIWKKLNP
jgi:hypothetical protein